MFYRKGIVSTTNKVFMITNLMFFAFVLGYLTSPPVEAAGSKLISACANKANGSLRLATKCTKLETLISWNQSGIQGPSGVQGPSGPKGNDASYKTKTVSITYLGVGSKCGDGSPTESTYDDAFTFKDTYPYRFDVSQLSKQSGWTLSTACSLKIKVLD
jgi:hypothetical protein